MAALPDTDRVDLWAAWMRVSTRGPVAVTKTQLRAALNAADDWVAANLATFEAALPAAVETPGPSQTLLANAATIAAGEAINDVSAGIADRSQSATLLQSYNAANTWMTNNAAGFVSAVLAVAPGLTQTQAFTILAAVAQRRASAGVS